MIRPGAIGDVILSLPALEAARADYTEVWAPRVVLPLIRFADRTRAIADTGIELVGVVDDARVPELESFDSIYSWYGTNRPEFRDAVRHLPFTFFPASPPPRVDPGDFAFLPAPPPPPTGVPRIAVPRADPEDFPTSPPPRADPEDFPASPPPLTGVPRIAIPRADPGDFPTSPPPLTGVPRIAVPRADPADFAIVHPFASSSAKRWPLGNFRAVAERLGVPIRWCAGPQEALEDATRIENLFDLASWIATARVYIGNDSGITHLAAAVGTPVVAIFLTTDPAIWRPRGDRVAVLERPDVSDVIRAARRFLG